MRAVYESFYYLSPGVEREENIKKGCEEFENSLCRFALGPQLLSF